MKVILLITALILAVSATEEDSLWNSFKVQHSKTYKNQAEEVKRFSIFKDNLKKIEEHNALYEQGLTTFKLGVTPFADMTQEEFVAMLNTQPRPGKPANRTLFKPTAAAPSSINWKDQGVVTNVKDQGVCGSCWAFSTTGSLEGAYAIKNGNLVSLSEQQLVDCTRGSPYNLLGCNGGIMDTAFEYIQQNGIESEASYIYLGIDGICLADSSKSVTKLSSFVDIPQGDEDALVTAVGTVGPVSVAVDATFMQLYIGGIFVDILCSKTNLNHGVLAVGYATSGSSDYWLVKNSWGSSWGEEGYIRMKRGKNQCGIATEASYPVI